MKKPNLTQRIRNYIKSHPEATPKEIATETKTNRKLVYVVRHGLKKAASAPVIPSNTLTISVAKNPQADLVNHPPHYKVGGIETIDFIEAKKLNYNLGNVVKYITRADHKGNRKEDLEKAMWYLKREINAL
jgi:hypothetical protein